MDGKIIERLIEIVERLGKAILERPARLEELLLESCTGCEGKIPGLVTALREGSLEHFLEGLNDPARERLIKVLSRLLQTVSTGEEPLQITTANGAELLFVKGGSFVMGELEGSESPAHRVNLTYDLYVGKYPVTFQEYDRYCDAIDYSGPDDDGIGRGRRPVVNLAWLQVIDYCNWLSEREGLPAAYHVDGNLLDENGRKTNDLLRVRGYRLLTEAEWEYAAYGGKKSRGYRYSGSDDVDEVAWYEENSQSMTQEVGRKAPNELGLYDMSGSVWEYCSDRSAKYRDREETNPHNILGSKRVLRGGCWCNSSDLNRVTCSEAIDHEELHATIGFRVCRIASAEKPKPTIQEAEVKLPAMEFVERGSFVMGNPSGYARLYTSPTRPVELTYDFHIGRYEVTFAEYDSFCAATGRQLPPDEGWGRGSRPVINVTWWDAVEYCNWLSEREGLPCAYDDYGYLLDSNGQETTDISTVVGYRLPTDAEWEYAARAGSKNRGYSYSGSDDIGEVGWFEKNSQSITHEVGKKKTNELGLYDMSGNVWEWCSDWYADDYFGQSPNLNPYNDSIDLERVMRGGSFGDVETLATVYERQYYQPSAASYDLGFRICRTAI